MCACIMWAGQLARSPAAHLSGQGVEQCGRSGIYGCIGAPSGYSNSVSPLQAPGGRHRLAREPLPRSAPYLCCHRLVGRRRHQDRTREPGPCHGQLPPGCGRPCAGEDERGQQAAHGQLHSEFKRHKKPAPAGKAGALLLRGQPAVFNL